MSYRDKIERALQRGATITLQSCLLRDLGEEKLEFMVQRTLEHYGHSNLMGPVHAAIRELVQNASKASLKRILFQELSLNPLVEEEYAAGMETFRKKLVQRQLSDYRGKIAAAGLHFTISLEHSPNALICTVNNGFPLLSFEEVRIREKFRQSQHLDNLYDFYVQFGDVTEGAGMGIAMVEILISEAGVNRHNFAIFTDPKTSKTVARIIVPMASDYTPPRKQFENEMKTRGIGADELRKLVRSGEVKLQLK